MLTMTAKDAKTNFGQLLDLSQRTPVIVTKNSRPVSIVLSIQDADKSLIPEFFMDKEAGYEAWFAEKVQFSLQKLHNNQTKTGTHDDVMKRSLARINERQQVKAIA